MSSAESELREIIRKMSSAESELREIIRKMSFGVLCADTFLRDNPNIEQARKNLRAVEVLSARLPDASHNATADRTRDQARSVEGMVDKSSEVRS